MSKRLCFSHSTENGGSYDVGRDLNYGDVIAITVVCCEEGHVLFHLKIVLNKDDTFVLRESSIL